MDKYNEVYQRLKNLMAPTSVLLFDGDCGITLHPQVPATWVFGRTTGFRLYVSVSNARKIPQEIFVYQREPIPYGNLAYKDVFAGIASPADLEEYPVGDPGTGIFFRMNSVDLVFRNIETLVDTLDAMSSDVWELCHAMSGMEMLSSLGAIEIGYPGTSSSSSSSSSSALSF